MGCWVRGPLGRDVGQWVLTTPIWPETRRPWGWNVLRAVVAAGQMPQGPGGGCDSRPAWGPWVPGSLGWWGRRRPVSCHKMSLGPCVHSMRARFMDTCH